MHNILMHIPIPPDKDAHVCEHTPRDGVHCLNNVARAQDGIGCRKAHLNGLQLRWFHMDMSAAFDTGGEEGSGGGGGARVGVWYASGYGGMGGVM
jgi:hypothetical protein